MDIHKFTMACLVIARTFRLGLVLIRFLLLLYKTVNWKSNHLNHKPQLTSEGVVFVLGLFSYICVPLTLSMITHFQQRSSTTWRNRQQFPRSLMNVFYREEEKLYIYLNRTWDSNPLILTSYVLKPISNVNMEIWRELASLPPPYMYTSFHINGYD